MIPIQFHASVKRFDSDDIGGCTIKFTVPDSDKDAAHEAGKLIQEDLLITVVRVKDLRAPTKEAKRQA